jgi:hypothetical protein
MANRKRFGSAMLGMVMAALLAGGRPIPALAAGGTGSSGVNSDEQKIRLDMHMASIEEDARTRRQVTGGLMLGMGAMFAAAGVSGGQNGASSSTLTTFWATSATFAVAGIVTLAWKTRFERETEVYNAMPEEGANATEAKIQHAERHLNDFLESGKSARRVWGVLGTALGATTGALYLARNPAFASDGWIFASTLMLGSGIASLFVQTSAEREAERYFEWKRGGAAGSGRAGLRFDGLSVGPLAAAASWSF